MVMSSKTLVTPYLHQFLKELDKRGGYGKLMESAFIPVTWRKDNERRLKGKIAKVEKGL